MSSKTAAAVLIALSAVATPASAASLTGMWDAAVTVDGLVVPFRFEIAVNGASARGAFFNGDERVRSTAGRYGDGRLELDFAQYGTRLTATLSGGALDGTYDRGSRGAYLFHATRFAAVRQAATRAPRIAGLWNVQVKSAKGESAWRLIVRQEGSQATAVILRVDGDTGVLSGEYRDGRFVLSHFSGARPTLVEITARPDGRLDLRQNGKTMLVATREEQARAEGLPEPSDPSRFTTVKNPSEPLRFSFPDLTGAIVTSADARFRGKVVLVSITGSWCPNCHDEAPFLARLYRTYRDRGLEIVALSFEEADQLANPTRLRAFVKQYGIEYPVLLAGEPEQLADKLPQVLNLNSFPTTIFIGRDGLVRGAHAGFAGRASGAFHGQTEQEIIAEVQRLLKEGRTTTE